MDFSENHRKIALSLSGGGVRAMAFHCGVLRYLAEHNQFENIGYISSVSGGSILTGLIFSLNTCSWPSSNRYLNETHLEIRRLLTTKSLAARALVSMLVPSNWVFVMSRANVLAKTIKKVWGVHESMSALPAYPAWQVKGTTAESGKRFGFARERFGDYQVGYCNDSDLELAVVMAVSAAFPGAIGPYVFETSTYKWHRDIRLV